MKITPTKCKDGKRHNWISIASEWINEAGERWNYLWCKKCGSVTETCNNRRCKEADGSLYIRVPGRKEKRERRLTVAELEEVPDE